jgi:hypothetical protein
MVFGTDVPWRSGNSTVWVWSETRFTYTHRDTQRVEGQGVIATVLLTESTLVNSVLHWHLFRRHPPVPMDSRGIKDHTVLLASLFYLPVTVTTEPYPCFTPSGEACVEEVFGDCSAREGRVQKCTECR